MVWPFTTSASVGRRGRTEAMGQSAKGPGISIESLQSRIALSVANAPSVAGRQGAGTEKPS